MGVTKNFFQAKPWTEILADQGYRNLAQRELEVLRRFTTEFSTHRETVVHLGVGGFREIPYIIESVKPCMYVVNDIVEEVANSVATEGQKVYPEISFRAICADLDHPDTIKVLHKQAIIGTMFILAGNGVIFANRELDQRIATVMNSCDLFMVTVETPHDNLAANYRIPACYELLSQSGLDVREDNTDIWYDESDQCLKVACKGRVLLTSYKPTVQQLRQRLANAGLVEVSLKEYPDIHMIGGLFKKK